MVHPFVETSKFPAKFGEPKDFYLIISAFAPYKRIDLAIEACARTGRRLVVIGKGQDAAKLKALAKGHENIQFHGGLSNEALGEFYRNARALLFPGLEDFGITPLESMYCGRPVIAYGKGGLLDTVTEETGIFFPEQTVESLVAALDRFEKESARFQPEKLRARALEFSRQHFREQYVSVLARELKGRA